MLSLYLKGMKMTLLFLVMILGAEFAHGVGISDRGLLVLLCSIIILSHDIIILLFVKFIFFNLFFFTLTMLYVLIL